MDIRPADLDALLSLLEAGDGIELIDEFPPFVLEQLPRLVDCDSISYNEVDPDEGRAVVALEPSSMRFDGDVEAFSRLMGQHPVIMWSQRTGDGRALRLSDFLSQDELHELEIYREVFRPLATEYQMSVGLPTAPPTIVGVALNRDGVLRILVEPRGLAAEDALRFPGQSRAVHLEMHHVADIYGKVLR